MTEPTVVADDLHVVYRVYEDLAGGRLGRMRRGGRTRTRRSVHALRGVSFTLHEGESVAIIGSNGSGKSTLLNALTGLLPLDSGSVRVRSRPTLLGVGAALQPSLSGRRNIEIGGLALGLSRQQVAASIDDIVSFAELEDSIDLPLESYSSGMRARLAFSIATATAPDILLVDEALAVGDESFRVRSAERIQEIREAAGTVVLVSHNMREVLESCERAIWIDDGAVRAAGPVEQIVDDYQRAAVRSVDTARRRRSEGTTAAAPEEPEVAEPADDGPRRFVLHVGPSWTGTQGVQKAIKLAKGDLAARGIWVPRVAGDPNHLALAAVATPDAAVVLGLDDDEWAAWRPDFERDFLAAAPAHGHALASTQHAASYLDEAAIARLCGLIRRAGFERIEVVTILRRQDERVSNRLVEILREGSFLEIDPVEFATPFGYDNAALVSRWRDADGVDDVIVGLYPDGDGPTPAEQVFAVVDAPMPPLQRDEQLDVLPRIPHDVYDHVRRIGLALRARDAISPQGARAAITVLSRRFEGGLALSRAEADELMARYAEGNRSVAEALGPEAVAHFTRPTTATDPGTISEFDILTELWRYAVSDP